MPIPFRDYQNFTELTAQYPYPENSDLLSFRYVYPALGLAGEAGEFVRAWWGTMDDKNWLLEAGDVCYYVARICTHTGLEFEAIATYKAEHPVNSEALMLEFMLKACDVVEVIKKSWRNRAVPIQFPQFQSSLSLTMSLLTEMVEVGQHTIPEVLDLNMEKLSRRKDKGTIRVR